MSEELLPNDRRVQKHLTPTGIRTIDLPLYNHVHYRLCYLTITIAATNFLSATRVRAIEITQKWRTKAWKSREKSKNVLEEKRNMPSKKFT